MEIWSPTLTSQAWLLGDEIPVLILALSSHELEWSSQTFTMASTSLSKAYPRGGSQHSGEARFLGVYCLLLHSCHYWEKYNIIYSCFAHQWVGGVWDGAAMAIVAFFGPSGQLLFFRNLMANMFSFLLQQDTC